MKTSTITEIKRAFLKIQNSTENKSVLELCKIAKHRFCEGLGVHEEFTAYVEDIEDVEACQDTLDTAAISLLYLESVQNKDEDIIYGCFDCLTVEAFTKSMIILSALERKSLDSVDSYTLALIYNNYCFKGQKLDYPTFLTIDIQDALRYILDEASCTDDEVKSSQDALYALKIADNSRRLGPENDDNRYKVYFLDSKNAIDFKNLYEDEYEDYDRSNDDHEDYSNRTYKTRPMQRFNQKIKVPKLKVITIEISPEEDEVPKNVLSTYSERRRNAMLLLRDDGPRVSSNIKYAIIAAGLFADWDIEQMKKYRNDSDDKNLVSKDPDFKNGLGPEWLSLWGQGPILEDYLIKRVVKLIEAMKLCYSSADDGGRSNSMIVAIAIEIQELILEATNEEAAAQFIGCFLLLIGASAKSDSADMRYIANALESEETENWNLAISDSHQIADGLLDLLRIEPKIA